MSTPVSRLLSSKEGSLVSASPGETVFAAIGRMVDRNVGAILIMDGDHLAGIFTERDYLRRIALEGRTSRETFVRDAMTAELVTVDPATTVDACLAIMTDRKIRHLPVCEDDRVVGVVSIGDCVRDVAERARGEAEHLTRFVSGGYPG